MLTNSELPMCLLHLNECINSFDFVLFHLYSTHPGYRQYYLNLKAKCPSRVVIFDNSAYEYYIKQQELDMDAFVEAINELQPTYYLCPDTLMNKDKTLMDTKLFLQKYGPKIKNSKPMVVAQGMTAEDLLECIDIYKSMCCTDVCLPFHNSFYKTYACEHTLNEWRLQFGQLTEDMKYAAGRCDFVEKYKKELEGFNYIHLLGSHNPWEKHCHESRCGDLINSMDTGYPVKVGYAGYDLFKEPNKPNVIIDDFLDEELSREVKTKIIENVIKFAEL